MRGTIPYTELQDCLRARKLAEQSFVPFGFPTADDFPAITDGSLEL